MWRRATDHPSEHDRARTGLRRWVAFTGAVVAAAASLTVLATAASAHDAPPTGTASCANTGTDWQVTDGTTFVENAGNAYWQVSFSTTAGTIAAESATTGQGNTGTGPTFSVTGIPSTASSITVTSTLVWGSTAGNYTDGTDQHTTTISRPAGGCLNSVPVPGAPTVNPATCSTVGSLVVPADTNSVTWSSTPTYHPGDTGAFTVTASTTTGNVFSDGKTTESFPVTVPGKVTGAACDTVVAPVAPTLTQASCTGPGSNSTPTLTIPATTGVVYTIAGKVVSGTIAESPGTTVTVVAVPAAGYKFAGADQSISTDVAFTNPGDCAVTATPVTPTISEIACNGPGSDAHSTLSIPTTTGVIYQINGATVSGDIDETGVTSVVVTAVPAAGYYFPTNTTSTWTEHFTTPDCTVGVTIVKPAFADDECSAGKPAGSAVYVIPATKHVTYYVNGTKVESGTHAATNGSTIRVTATPDAGYTVSSVSSWTHTFAATPKCHGTDAVTVHRTPTTTTPSALASTGVPTSTLLIGGAVVVLLGIGFLFAGGVTGRKNRM